MEATLIHVRADPIGNGPFKRAKDAKPCNWLQTRSTLKKRLRSSTPEIHSDQEGNALRNVGMEGLISAAVLGWGIVVRFVVSPPPGGCKWIVALRLSELRSPPS